MGRTRPSRSFCSLAGKGGGAVLRLQAFYFHKRHTHTHSHTHSHSHFFFESTKMTHTAQHTSIEQNISVLSNDNIEGKKKQLHSKKQN